ncbi:unnamed protein product, partial [Rotaria socialis]
KFADFGKAHNLTSAVINQINELRSEEEFSRLTGQITEFCVENNIGLSIKVKERTISTRFLNCSVTKQAFLTIIYLAIGALTIPVCSTTTERTFSK